MKMKIFFVVVVNVLSIVFISGCSANKIEGIKVDKQNTDKIKILWADVYQKDDETWICGVMKQNGYQSSFKTHLDILVISENDSVQYETFSDDLYVPRNKVGTSDWVRFKIKLAQNISTDSRINVKVHSEKHEDVKSGPI